jgi:uncharacterized protein
MDGLVEYSIPIKGLRDGIHRFHFKIDRNFFKNFENSPVEEGDVDMTLTFDKRPDLYVLQFNFEGTIQTECDRCLETIDLPISGNQHLLVKFSYEEEAEEADVIYINPEDQKLDVSKYVYEFIILAIPIIKVYNCEDDENKPCNEEMLRYLDRTSQEPQQEDEAFNPIWEELKKLSDDD